MVLPLSSLVCNSKKFLKSCGNAPIYRNCLLELAKIWIRMFIMPQMSHETKISKYYVIKLT